MFLTIATEQNRITCGQHNKFINSICLSKDCQLDKKICCVDCQHTYCDKIIQVEDIPEKVGEHNSLYEIALESINELERHFLEKTKFIKQILGGYQLDQTFQYITLEEDLNSLVIIIQKLPQIVEKIQQNSTNIKNLLNKYTIQRIDQLNIFWQENLNHTIQRRPQTAVLMKTQNNPVFSINNFVGQQNNNNELEILLQQGEETLRLLNYRQCLEKYQKVLNLQPQNIKARVGLMNVLKEMNYFNCSQLIQRSILQTDPQNFDAVLLKGTILYNQKQYSQSIEYIKSIIKYFPDQDQQRKLLKLLTNNYLENNQIQDARRLLQNIREQYGYIIDFYQGLAKCEMLDNSLESAKENIMKASLINQYDQENNMIQIQILQKNHQYENCLDLIQTQLINSRITNKNKEILMKLKPNILCQQQKYEEAMVSCQAFLEHYLPDTDIYFIFGICLYESRIMNLAYYFFKKVMDQEPNHIDIKYQINQTLKKLQQQNQQTLNQYDSLSQSTFRQKKNTQISIDVQPNNYQRLLEDAAQIFLNRNIQDTDIFLQRCINMFRFNEKFFILQATYYIRNISLFPDYKEKAIQCVNSALQLNSNNSEAKNLQAQLQRPQKKK